MKFKFLFLTALAFTSLVFLWASFVYFFLDTGYPTSYFPEAPSDGWTHGAITGVLIPIGLAAILFISFKTKSVISGITTYLLMVLLILVMSGIGFGIYHLQGCPRPRAQRLVEEKPKAFGKGYLNKLSNELQKGCQGYTYYSAESTDTYIAFLGGLARDLRVIYITGFFGLIFVMPISLIGAFFARRLRRRTTPSL